jgi:fructose-1,6-bisphosphatase/inositol monophosphatase family enzyme
MIRPEWQSPFELKKQLREMNHVFIEASDRFILPRFQNLTSHDVIQNGKYDEILTQADRESSDWILKHCRMKFPASYSEEEICEERFNVDALWQIDPLDGTHEFKHHHPGFAVQGALLIKNEQGLFEPIGGIIYSPVDRYSVYGGKGIGLFRQNGTREVSILPIQKSSAIRITLRQLDLPRGLEILQEKLKKHFNCPIDLNFGGGAASSFLQMISGFEQGVAQAYFFPRQYTHEWDLSAAEVLFHELKGWISDFEGHDFTYNRSDTKNRNGFIAALGINKKDILPLVKTWALNELNHE